jgi:hypothetical protein
MTRGALALEPATLEPRTTTRCASAAVRRSGTAAAGTLCPSTDRPPGSAVSGYGRNTMPAVNRPWLIVVPASRTARKSPWKRAAQRGATAMSTPPPG